MKLLQIILVLASLSTAYGYRILVLLPFPGPSHFLMFKTIIKELIDRGHEITILTSFPFNEKLENYTEILIDPPWDIESGMSQKRIYELKFVDEIGMLMAYWNMGIGSTMHCLENPSVRNFTLYDNSHFDLILSEQFFQEALLMFAYKYKAPIVSISTYGYSDFFDRMMGTITPYSFVPHLILSNYNDQMSFFQRIKNFLFSMADALLRHFYYMPTMDSMAHKYFSHIENRPSVQELEKSVSVILVNNYVAMFKARPSMPGIIDIGGAHIKPLRPLPSHIKKFIDEAQEGVIYMSLGAYVQSSSMPKEKLEMFIKVFGSLKQRVLWKYEKDDLKNLPSNLMISKWMPQAEILNHPNVVLFISHGGLFGTIEGSYFGRPILFMPFYGDQYRNAKMAQRNGYAQHVLFTELGEDLLMSKIKEMIENEEYMVRAREMSAVLQDSPVKPLDLSMYWIEYAARHKGAKHLKSQAVKLSWFEYLMLDVLGFMLISGWIAYKLVKYVLLKLFIKKIFKAKIE